MSILRDEYMQLRDTFASARVKEETSVTNAGTPVLIEYSGTSEGDETLVDIDDTLIIDESDLDKFDSLGEKRGRSHVTVTPLGNKEKEMKEQDAKLVRWGVFALAVAVILGVILSSLGGVFLSILSGVFVIGMVFLVVVLGAWGVFSLVGKRERVEDASDLDDPPMR